MAEGTTSSAPASMSAALEQASSAADASAASTPSSTSTPAESSAPVASEPATSAPTTSSAPAPTAGRSIPYDRFTEVNNAKKALETQVQQLAWAQGISPEEVRTALAWRQRATTDHAGFLREYLANAPPDRAEAIRSEAARILAGTRKPEDAEPPPDLQTEVGPMRSPKNQAEWNQWYTRQLKADFAKDLAPLKQQLSTYEKREQDANRLHGIVQFTQHAASDAKTWPHFETFKQDIADAYRQAPQPDPSWNDREKALFETQQLQAAYIKVLGKQGLAPQTQTQQQVMADLSQRASAGTESGRAAVSTSSKPKSMLDALERASAASGHR